MNLDKYIQIQQGFQSSVNIAYDFFDEDKLRNFIPTIGFIEILENLLQSTYDGATDRAKILVGAYGKGKSHAILVLLSILSNKNKVLFSSLLEQLKIYKPEIYNYVKSYIESDKKILPVLIQGSNDSLTQSFLSALEKALQDADLADLMPETHFQAALRTISRWKEEYPDTYTKFVKVTDGPVEEFCSALRDYNVAAYEQFKAIYPSLTSGSEFNPFLGFDVVELYSKVVASLCKRGYAGIYVVYDEFGKYLEANITRATVSDTKMLQDFAEKCSRSKEQQMHLLLIAHKDIANYIDKLPKQKMDGWKGVSERFVHLEMQNNFSQVYELMSAVIKKDQSFFAKYYEEKGIIFANLENSTIFSSLFSELSEDRLNIVLQGCYPLHPVTSFILPRLSELVAQNERTLFTFLSSNNRNTLASFLAKDGGDFTLLTPDLLYDYFETSLKNVPYNSEIHNTYVLTNEILNKLDDNDTFLETRIIKTIALVYIINRFEKLPPTADLLIYIFSFLGFSNSTIARALEYLQNKKYVIYANTSNHYLRLKSSTGSDIQKLILDTVDKYRLIWDETSKLTEYFPGLYMYPIKYNDEMCIVRYFDFRFIKGSAFLSTGNLADTLEEISGDGLIYGVIPESQEQIEELCQKCLAIENSNPRLIFIIPKDYIDVKTIIFKYAAVKQLKVEAKDDSNLLLEYDVYEEDLEEFLINYIHIFIKPEQRAAFYYQGGEKRQFYRKAQVSQCLSDICATVYDRTPIINNDSLNKNYLPTNAINSRNKVVEGLLSTKWQPMLGLKGYGQDVSFMRSSMLVKDLIDNIGTNPIPRYHGNRDANLQAVLDIIERFFLQAETGICFGALYKELTSPDFHIGLRKGTIPIYLAFVLHQFKEHLVIRYKEEELEITADLLNSINEEPDDYVAYLEEWNEAKATYIRDLENIFEEQVIEEEKEYNSFSYIVRAMQRWFVSLPQYSKNLKKIYIGHNERQKIDLDYANFIRTLSMPTINAREYLFEKLPVIFEPATIETGLATSVNDAKQFFDGAKAKLIDILAHDLTIIFEPNAVEGVSLPSAVREWVNSLSKVTTSRVFEGQDGIILKILRNITNDKEYAVDKLAKAATGLSIDDWNDATVDVFIKAIKTFKRNIEDYDKKSSNDKVIKDGYTISIVDAKGKSEIKHFARVATTKTGSLLRNEIDNAIEEMGLAITREEKRQILMDILEKLC